jgi:hypothetical protein
VTVTVAVSVTDSGDVTVRVAVGVFVGVAVCVGVAVGVDVGAPITGRVGESRGVGELGCIVGATPAGAVGVATDDVSVARICCVERMRVAEAEETGMAVTLPNGNKCTPTSGVAKSAMDAGASVGEMSDWP